MKRNHYPLFFPAIAAAVASPASSYASSGASHIDGTSVSLLWVIPFVGILLSIALFPLVAPRFWHRHYGKISFSGACCSYPCSP